MLLPQINIHVVNESQRTVPVNTRDSMIQVDIWTRNNALEMETIYERVIQLLSYQTANIESNTAHVFWQKLSGGVDVPETDRRIWHKAMTFVVWSVKP